MRLVDANTSRTSRRYGIAQSVVFCAFAAAVLFGPGPLIFAPGHDGRWAGGVLCLAGIALLLTAIRSIGRSIQIAPEPRADAALATHGPYRWFRHPIYTAIIAIVVGLFLRRPTVTAAIAAAVTTAFLVVKVRFEERLLLARYPEYADYRRRTMGVIPSLT